MIKLKKTAGFFILLLGLTKLTMLVSLHMPKTAGESFFNSLKDYYGDQVQRDYEDKPINTPVLRRNSNALKMCVLNALKSYEEADCIHGHFLPLKYMLCKNAVFVTWMRDPVERLASHYFFWKRTHAPEITFPLRKKVIEENWSLEKFCLSPEFRNFYSQFLWGFPIGRFSFIGITEDYDNELAFFYKHFFKNDSFQVYKKKRNLEKEKGSYFEDKEFRARVERYHSKDVALYRKALEMKERRIQAGASGI